MLVQGRKEQIKNTKKSPTINAPVQGPKGERVQKRREKQKKLRVTIIIMANKLKHMS